MNRFVSVAAIAAVPILGCASSGAYSNDEVQHHEYPHHHLAVFVGGGFERDKKNHEEKGTALGVKYELRFSEKWGAGLDVEHLEGGGTHRSWVAAVPLSYHPDEHWHLFAGPGMEFGGKEDKALFRVGFAYEIPFHQRWSVSPEFLVDLIEGGATTYVLGISVGYQF